MHSFDHVAFQVSDLDTSIQFYLKKLGFTLLSKALNPTDGEAYAFLTLADLRLELIQDLNSNPYHKPVPKPPYCPHLAIETDDLAAAVEGLRRAGVSILHGPLEIPGEETWVYFTDLDNNVMEYIQWFRKI